MTGFLGHGIFGGNGKGVVACAKVHYSQQNFSSLGFSWIYISAIKK